MTLRNAFDELANQSTLQGLRDRQDDPYTVEDDFVGGEVLADQNGVGDVLTYTFSSPVNMVVVQPTETGVRADPFGGTPADGTGIPLVDAAPNYIPVITSEVKVWAAAGSVAVWGFRRA